MQTTSNLNVTQSRPVDSFVLTLENIAAHPEFENEWLDLLSQLEYVGCRKIVRSVAYERVDLCILQHIAEEASHAFLLKSLVKSAGATWKAGRLSPIGWHYFQTLDAKVSELVNDQQERYPAVSWAIEQRVLWVYPLYEKATNNERVRRVISRILAQEKRHGSQFDQIAFSDSFRQSVLEIESQLWETFSESLQTALIESTHCLNTSPV